MTEEEVKLITVSWFDVGSMKRDTSKTKDLMKDGTVNINIESLHDSVILPTLTICK